MPLPNQYNFSSLLKREREGACCKSWQRHQISSGAVRHGAVDWAPSETQNDPSIMIIAFDGSFRSCVDLEKKKTNESQAQAEAATNNTHRREDDEE